MTDIPDALLDKDNILPLVGEGLVAYLQQREADWERVRELLLLLTWIAEDMNGSSNNHLKGRTYGKIRQVLEALRPKP